MKLIWGPRATEDLRSIWHYISADDRAQADLWLDRIIEKVELLRSNPRLGPPHRGMTIDLRSLRIGRYRIFYRLSDDRVDVLRVLHGARDLSRVPFD